MNIRIPQSTQAAGILRNFLKELGIQLKHTQALEAIARLHGYQNWQAMKADVRFQDAPALKPESSNEYRFASKDVRNAWITVENISVNVNRTDEGVVVDLFGVGREDAGSLTSTWLTFDEAMDQDDDDNLDVDIAAHVINRTGFPCDADNGWFWVSNPDSDALLCLQGAQGIDFDGPFDSREDAAADYREHLTADVAQQGESVSSVDKQPQVEELVNWANAPAEPTFVQFNDNPVRQVVYYDSAVLGWLGKWNSEDNPHPKDAGVLEYIIADTAESRWIYASELLGAKFIGEGVMLLKDGRTLRIFEDGPEIAWTGKA